MVKRVVSGYGRQARTVGLPGSESAGGVDFASRDDVRDRGDVLPRGVSANIMQFDQFELKVSRVFVGLGGSDDQARVVADDCIDEDRALFTVSTRLFGTRPSHVWRRNVDLEAVHSKRAYMHRLDEQAGQARVKGEVVDGDEGQTCCCGGCAVPRVEAQAVAGDFEPTKNRDANVIQFHAAVEPGAECFGNASF